MIEDIEFIALNMRDEDRAEIFGMRHDDNPITLAAETFNALRFGLGRIFYAEGRPAAVCGAVPRHPGVWYAFAYGTHEWGSVVRSVTAYARNELGPALRENAHRVECQSRFDHVSAHKWLAWLGAERESVLRQFGKDGADYFNYVWTR